MKFSITRDTLLNPLHLVEAVVERRQTMPILANLLMVLDDGMLSLTATDGDIELVGRVAVDSTAETGTVTVPASKLLEICRSLPEGSAIDFSRDTNRMVVRSGLSRFVLPTLPPENFPNMEDSIGTHQFRIQSGPLLHLIDRVGFAMADKDVRYYLNGMLWELESSSFRVVATDGHRLAVCTAALSMEEGAEVRPILPRKGVFDLARLLQDEEQEVVVILGSNHLRANIGNFTFTTKLVSGKYPNYEAVIPKSSTHSLLASRQELRDSLSRAAIASNDTFQGVRLELSARTLKIFANIPEQEEAEDELSVDYQDDELQVAFNVNYLQQVLKAMSSEKVRMSFSGTDGPALLEEAEDSDCLYVIQPMRL